MTKKANRKTVILYLGIPIVAVVIICTWYLDLTYLRVMIGSAIVQHRSIYREIEKAGIVPESLDEVIDRSEWKKPLKTEYFSDAWGKSDQILLKTPVRSIFKKRIVIAYGNGSREFVKPSKFNKR